MVEKIGAFKVLALLRNNLDFDENRGSIQLDLTYPISDRYEIYCIFQRLW